MSTFLFTSPPTAQFPRLLSREQAAVAITRHIKVYLARRELTRLKREQRIREMELAAEREAQRLRELREEEARIALAAARKERAQASLLRCVLTLAHAAGSTHVSLLLSVYDKLSIDN